MERFNELEFLGNKLCIALLRVDFDADEVYVISNSLREVENGRTFNWTTYTLTGIQNLFSSNPSIRQELTSNALKRAAIEVQMNGQRVIHKELMHTAELSAMYNLNIIFRNEHNKLYAYIAVSRDNDQRLLHSIVKTFVFNSCDYFVKIDVPTDQFVMLAAAQSDTAVPILAGCYTEEMHRYNKIYVAPEDYQYITDIMEIKNMVKILERQKKLVFYSGHFDSKSGVYKRKKLEARYFGNNKNVILLYRTDITQLYNQELQKVQRLEKMLERAYTDALTGLLNHQGMENRAESLLEHLGVIAKRRFSNIATFDSKQDKTSLKTEDTASTVEHSQDDAPIEIPRPISAILPIGSSPSQTPELHPTNLEDIGDYNDSSCALIFIDLDNFKAVNDKFGHPAGDEVLRQTANIIKGELQFYDCAGRMGGDEFEILLTKLKNNEQAIEIAQHILERVEAIYIADGSVQVSCSIGIAYSNEHGHDYRTLVDYADKCVYLAKAQGKGRIITKVNAES